MKKPYIIIGIILVTILLGAIVVVKGKNNSNSTVVEITPTAPPEEGKILDFSLENPLIVAYPRNDGNALSLEISKLNGVKSVSYEMVYQTKTQEEGTLGTPITLKQNETSIKRELLFGTCSKNVCRYHEGVEKGSLSIRLNYDQRPSDEWRADFVLFKPTDRILSSSDGSVSITLNVNPNQYSIVLPVSSLPAPIEGKKIIGQPYGYFSANPVKQKNMKLSLTHEGLDETYGIYGWDSDQLKWVTYESTVKGNTISSIVDRLTIFALVK